MRYVGYLRRLPKSSKRILQVQWIHRLQSDRFHQTSHISFPLEKRTHTRSGKCINLQVWSCVEQVSRLQPVTQVEPTTTARGRQRETMASTVGLSTGNNEKTTFFKASWLLSDVTFSSHNLDLEAIQNNHQNIVTIFVTVHTQLHCKSFVLKIAVCPQGITQLLSRAVRGWIVRVMFCRWATEASKRCLARLFLGHRIMRRFILSHNYSKRTIRKPSNKK